MKFLYKILFWTAFLPAIGGLGACSSNDEPDPGENPYLNIQISDLNFGEDAQSQNVAVSSNVDWTCSSDVSWIDVVRDRNDLMIRVTENDQKSVREGTVLVSATSSLHHTINIKQLGWGKAILVSAKSSTMEAVGGTLNIDVTANVDIACKVSANWIVYNLPSRSDSHPMVTNTHNFSIRSNAGDDSRNGSITFMDAETGSDVEPVMVSVSQKGLGTYSTGDISDIKDDLQVKVVRGEASSYQGGTPIENSFDGDKSTIYHSNWSNGGSNYYPITLIYYFDNEDMDYFIYYPRMDGGYNGHFEDVDIEVCSVANTRAEAEWKAVMSYDFEGKSSATRVDFPEPQIGVTAVKFIVKKGYGDGQGFVSCSEMEFYKKNPDNFNWSTLFTDASCSELKAGITEQDIENCQYSFFKNIAFYLYHNRYGKEFRINSFKPYEHPNRQSATNKTSAYSILDNPTGISATSGETLIVLADLKGESASLRVQNLNVPGGDGFNSAEEYPLSTGVNKLKINKSGLIYVMYHTDKFETAPEISIHFATGKVNGYYDSQNPEHKGRAKELLNNATDSYFDVVGKYAHLTFPTTRFRNHTKDLHELIEAYDKMVYSEQLLLGLDKYDRMFHNRMYFNVIYTSYMYSTTYHTAYHDDTLSELCNETKFTSSSIWGPAHEVGHSNQTRPGLRWLGMTEVTNNIMSEYIQTTVFGQESRLQSENMGSSVNPNRYSLGWNGIIVAQIPFCQHSDVFCQLIPFWQLELYFGKVLGRTPYDQDDHGGFYPDVYEYYRTHSDMSDNGACQLEFAYVASLCSGYDLTDFFEKWGFFRVVNTQIDDYGSGTLRVTEASANRLKDRIAALGFKKPEVPLEYINDLNYEYVKSKAEIVPGTATRSGKTLTIANWKNVMVYEVRENDMNGNLVHVSDGKLRESNKASFQIPSTWQDNYKVYAVQFDNKRIEVTF